MKKISKMFFPVLVFFLATFAMLFIGCEDLPENSWKVTDLNILKNLGGIYTEYFESVIESGNYYIAVGYSDSNLSALTGGDSTTGGQDFVIAKFNKADLSLVSINNLGGGSDDYLCSVIESGDYYIAVGYSKSNLSALSGSGNAGGTDFVISRFNKASLALDELYNFGGTGADYLSEVIEYDSYYIAVGTSESNLSVSFSAFGGSSNAGGLDFVIAKFDKSDLGLNKINNFGGSNDENLSSLIKSGDYYIAVGYSGSDLSINYSSEGGTASQGNRDFVIAQFNKSDLSLDVINNLGGSDHDYFSSLIESGDYYIAVGHSKSNLSTMNLGGYDFAIARFSKLNLGLVAINSIGGAGGDYLYSLVESDGYYVGAGNSDSDLSCLNGGVSKKSASASDAVIVKFNKSSLDFDKINNFPTDDDKTSRFNSIIESGNYYIVAGASNADLSDFSGGSDTTGEYDFVIAKLGK